MSLPIHYLVPPIPSAITYMFPFTISPSRLMFWCRHHPCYTQVPLLNPYLVPLPYADKNNTLNLSPTVGLIHRPVIRPLKLHIPVSAVEQRRLCCLFYNWQLAQHAEKIKGDIIAPSRVLENLAAVKRDSKDKGPGQGNKAEKKKKKKKKEKKEKMKNETFKILLEA